MKCGAGTLAPLAHISNMPVAMARPTAKGRGGLHTREIDHYVNEVVDNPTVFVVPSEKLAGQVRLHCADNLPSYVSGLL